MRRIYESDALARDKDEPFAPGERSADYEPQSFRSIDAARWTDRLLPQRFHRRAVSVAVAVPTTEFESGQNIPFRVTMKNRLPIPVTIRTNSPILWKWRVDGHEEASHVPLRDPPERNATFSFNRGERKQFRKQWSQLFRVSETEWEPADPGEYTIEAAVNVDDPGASNLSDAVSIRILP